MTFSVKNKLVLEQYVKEGLKPKISGGLATPGQRDGVKGLRVLMDGKLDDQFVPKGSIAYIPESYLHNHDFASKPLTCDTISEKFILVEAQFIIFVSTPDDNGAA